jgi:acyl-CoA synthetase (AMP-forming)/AMP-acid ligase II
MPFNDVVNTPPALRGPDFPPTIWDLVLQRAEETPGRIILEDDRDRTVTATGLLNQAEEVAAGLQERGVEEGSVVSWQLPTWIESCILQLALSRLGAVQNPILPLLRAREVSFIVGQTGARLLITPERWRNFDYASMAKGIAAETGVDPIVVDEKGLPKGDIRTLPPPPGGVGEPIRHIYYSSGSTADPKGAYHSDRSAMHSASGMIAGYEVGPDDVLPIPFPYTHIGGMALTVSCLHTGCRLVMMDTFDPLTSPLLMRDKGATLTGTAVPFYNAYLATQEREGDVPLFPRLKAFTGGGAPKSPELYFAMKKVFGVGIVSGYGLTEFPVAASCTIRDDDDDLAHSEGRPSPGVELRVVDSAGQSLPAGHEGEIRVKGPQMFKGYVDASLNADVIDREGFFRTGDLGILRPRGHIQVTGRLKDIIIRNAENVSALEVENLLYTHPNVADVAVIGLPDPKTGERACAVIVLAKGAASLALSEVIAFCQDHNLANQKIPEQVEHVVSLPRNSLGKVLKRELREIFGG